ncbi:MAG: DUF11 domain-containing protein, partial [bacterium]|nr:DUF11 domain-containing protein [bacterium]
LGQGNLDQEAPILAAGHTAVQMTTLSAAELSGVDVLFVQNPSNGSYGTEYLSALSDIEDAVSDDGLVLVIFDRYVTPPDPTILPGGSGFTIVRDLSPTERDDLNVLDATTKVTDGIGGTIVDTSLDGGNFSSHGYVLDDAALPADAVKILSRLTPTQIATLSYKAGAGRVIYAPIPLDQFLADCPPSPSGCTNTHFAGVYAPNVIEYAAVLATPAPDLEVTLTNGRSVSVPGASTTYTITVTNKGNADAVNATVNDDFPLTNVNWSCAPTGTAWCTPAGSDDIDDTVTVPPGDSVVYTATGTISSAATGTLSNTASATVPEDSYAGNDDATDEDTLEPSADLDLTKSGPASGRVDGGDSLSYTLTLTNNGPSDASDVTLSDPTPAGLTFKSAVSDDVDVDCTSGFPCTVGPWAGGDVLKVTVTFDVPSPYLGPDPIRNLALVTSSTPDPVSTNNAAVAATAVGRPAVADLEVVVTGPPSAADGSTVTYRVDVTNLGTESAFSVELAAPTPSDLQFDSATYPPCATVTSCNLGSLGPGTTKRVEVTYSIPPGHIGSISFTASVSSSTNDSNTSNNSATEMTPIGADTADLRVEKTGPTDADPGDDLVYLISVSNQGPADATGVTLTDLTPTGLTFDSATAPCDASGFPCTLGTLAKGASIDVTATFNVPSAYADADPVENVASAMASNVPEGFPDDNDSSALTGLAGEVADVSIEKYGPGSVAAGDTLTYTLVVKNLGPGVAYDVTVDEPTPSGLSFHSADDPCGNGFPCTLGDLQPDTAAIVGVNFSVPANYAGADPIDNTATVTPTGNVDPNTSNNSASASTDLDFIANLAVTKDDGQATTSPGLPLTYTITVTNQGPSNVAGVTVTDTFPPELTGVSWNCVADGLASCGTPTSGSADISVTAVELPAGDWVTYTVNATVDDAASGTLLNTASAAVPGGTTDPDLNNNSADDDDTQILQPVDLRVEKTGPASAVPGTDLVYTVTLTNEGPGTAYDVELTDPTPDGLIFKSVTPLCDNGVPASSCALGNLGDDQVKVVTLTYEVPSDYSVPDPIINTATVSTSTHDTNAANNSSTVTTPIDYTADLSVIKNDWVEDLVPGDTVTYDIVVENHGPRAVTGATVVDSPPLTELTTPITWSCTPEPLPPGASCTGAGTDFIDDTVTLPVGGTLNYSLTATVRPDAQLTVINRVDVAVPANLTDPVSGNDWATASSGLKPHCDLEVTKTNGLDEAAPGASVTYTVVVTNHGPSNCAGVTVKDTTPNELNGVSWSCTPAGGASCTASGSGGIQETVDMPVGSSVTFTIGGTINPGATGTLVNTATATVAAGDVDEELANNTATDDDPLVREADLELSKMGPATVDRGDPLDYTLELVNRGPSTAAAIITDPTPPGLTLTSVTVSSGTAPCDVAPYFPCLIDPLAAGDTVTMTVTYQVPAGYDGPDPIVNVAAVSSDAVDPDPSDNRTSSATPVDRAVGTADIEVIKKAPEVSKTDSTVTYVLEVTNHGPDDAQGVVLSETYPTDFVFQSATDPCTGGFACPLGTIPVGAVKTVEVTLLTPAEPYSGPTIVANTASVTSTTTDPNPANDSATDTTTLIDDPIDLVLRKIGPLSVTLDDVTGADLHVSLVVTQEGPGEANNVWLDDPTPTGLTFVSATAPCQGGFPCFLGTVTTSATVIVDVVFHVPPGYAGDDPIENIATIDANELDADTDNNTALLLTGIGAKAADVEVIKIGPSEVTAGADAQYTVTVRNLGPGLATDVVLDDPAPPGTSWVAATVIEPGSCTPAPCPCADGFPCSLGDLEAGSAVAVGITFQLDPALAASTVIENEAIGSTTSSDTDPDNDSDTASTTSTVSADLVIVKSNGVIEIPAGAPVTYVVTVFNQGPSDA